MTPTAYAPLSTHVLRTDDHLRCLTCGMRRPFGRPVRGEDHESFAREHAACARNGSELRRLLGFLPIPCEACGSSKCASVNEPGGKCGG